MDLNIQDRTALVLGASGGLGGAVAVTLAKEGVRVALAGRDERALAKTAAAVEAVGGKSIRLVWDISDLGSIGAHVGRIEAELGEVDILFNNTGGPPPTSAAGQNPEAWSRHFQQMVLSVIAITDRVLPGMLERRWGRVITSSSSGVIAPIANLAISNALRMSLVGWSKTLAREVGRSGVTCNLVVPGRVATDRIRYLDEQRALREGRPVEQVVAESTASIPLGRYGDPKEYGDAVAFLASDRAAYITGSVVRVDGGYVPSI